MILLVLFFSLTAMLDTNSLWPVPQSALGLILAKRK